MSEPATVLEKLGYFLSRRDKLIAAGILALMVLGAGFEALGVALIFPFIALINNPDVVQQPGVLHWLYDEFQLVSTREFLVWCGVALMLIYLLKALYLGFLYYAQYKFVFSRQVALSHRLLRAYLRSPYTFHLQRNTAELLQNVNSEVLWIFSGVLVPASNLLIEGLVVMVIVAVLLSVEPVAALGAIGILGVASALFYRAIRKRTGELGASQQHHNAEMTKRVNEGLGGVKEVKVLGREEFFVNAYTRSSEAYAKAMRYLRTVNELPRLAIEGLTIGGMLGVILLMLARGEDMRGVLPTLGLFAMAAVRLMPSLNRIVSGMTMIRYYTSSIHVVYKDLRDLEDVVAPSSPSIPSLQVGQARPTDDPLPFMRTIELRRVRYQYPSAHIHAVDDVTLAIQKGHSVAFVGSSGAGKTTVVDIILGLLVPTEGQVLVDGVDVHTHIAAWQRKIGYIPQRIYLLDDTIRRNIALGLPDGEIDEARVWHAVQAAQLEDLITSLPNHLDTVIGEHGVRLSGGQRQRIGIARALYHDPDVLVMDEATSALDNETEQKIANAIALLSREKTVITIAHRLTTVRNSDCLFFMKNGRVITAAPYRTLFEVNQDFRSMVRAAAAAHEVLA